MIECTLRDTEGAWPSTPWSPHLTRMPPLIDEITKYGNCHWTELLRTTAAKPNPSHSLAEVSDKKTFLPLATSVPVTFLRSILQCMMSRFRLSSARQFHWQTFFNCTPTAGFFP